MTFNSVSRDKSIPFYGWKDGRRKEEREEGRKGWREEEEKVKDLIMYLYNLTHCKDSEDVEQINVSLSKSIKVSYELISTSFSVAIGWIPSPSPLRKQQCYLVQEAVPQDHNGGGCEQPTGEMAASAP